MGASSSTADFFLWPDSHLKDPDSIPTLSTNQSQIFHQKSHLTLLTYSLYEYLFLTSPQQFVEPQILVNRQLGLMIDALYTCAPNFSQIGKVKLNWLRVIFLNSDQWQLRNGWQKRGFGVLSGGEMVCGKFTRRRNGCGEKCSDTTWIIHLIRQLEMPCCS